MTSVRGLYVPGTEPSPRTNTVPRGPNREALLTRKTLGDFLEANLIRPLHFDDNQNERRIEDALDTMTLNERIAIEIEMQTRFSNVHSFDYEPF